MLVCICHFVLIREDEKQLFGKGAVAVLDLLATKVQVVVAEQIVNNNIRLLAKGSADYAGYVAGEFLEPENLYSAISDAVLSVIEVYGKKIDSIVVGVPSEFCNYALRNLKADYSNKVVIKQRHIDELFQSVKDDEIDCDYTVISKSPIYYILDDGVQTLDPIKEYSKNLGAKASCILAKNSFIDTISEIIEGCGIKECKFVPVALAVNGVLLPEEVKHSGAIVIDFDYVSTSVTSFMGEGVVDLKTFPVGEGHVLSDLVEVMNISYFIAEALKKEIILTLQPNPMDVYEIRDATNNVTKISANIASEVVLARLDSIADIINNILINFQYRHDMSKPIYITGSGIIDMKGARNYLSNKLNRRCIVLSPSQIEYNKARYAHMIALVQFALHSNI
ncbi:MAG: hypothetical protein E7361_00390 [Clostridiales bacterium]|nr:hypothetical protein [Clostridiales bacterium]